LIRYTWADVMKMILGIQQKGEHIRRAAYIIHCSLVEKKHRADMQEIMPLPYDSESEKTSIISRLKQKQLQLREDARRTTQSSDNG
jgi:hypothetical protein